VIEFETPPNDVFDKHGSYGDIAIKLLRRTLAASAELSPLLKVTKVSALDDDASWPALDEVDAVLLTGSSKLPCLSVGLKSANSTFVRVHCRG
jgi:hypothetical protein